VGKSVSGLALNDDGWPTLNAADGAAVANPLTVTVTLNCPTGGSDCHYPAFLFDVTDLIGDPRYYVYAFEANSVANEANVSCGILTSSGVNSQFNYTAECVTSSSGVDLGLSAGQQKTMRWHVWVQPSEAATLQFSATWGLLSANRTVSVPRAAIHPIVFIPGLGATQPPRYGNWSIVEDKIGEVAHYTDLNEIGRIFFSTTTG
jgi:hypothetical protein